MKMYYNLHVVEHFFFQEITRQGYMLLGIKELLVLCSHH